ncbi:MAG: pseudouridine synthase [Myxococcota bacterium]|nr:pseudouridine synthase [Myxococcota bacterium]
MLHLLGEDAHFLYVEKPAGLPVFPRSAEAATSTDPGTVLGRLGALRPGQLELDWPDGFAGGIVHRLDNQTSGLLVVAKSLSTLAEGRRLFGGLVLKRYWFLSQQSVPWEEHRIEHPIAHHKTDRRKMIWRRGKSTPHRGQWRPATTVLLRVCAGLWEARMSTGVRHQIRLHAASVGLALQGDSLYGGGGDGAFFLHHLGPEAWPEPLPESALPTAWPGPRGPSGSDGHEG